MELKGSKGIFHCNKWKCLLSELDCVKRQCLAEKKGRENSLLRGRLPESIKRGCVDCGQGREIRAKCKKGGHMDKEKEGVTGDGKKAGLQAQKDIKEANEAEEIKKNLLQAQVNKAEKQRDDERKEKRRGRPMKSETMAIKIDFTEHNEIFKRIKEKAKANLRTAENQILWTLIDAFTGD